MADDYKIPAASISDVDLAAIAELNPAAAKEIARLGELMECGNETKEDFRMLCQLLHEAGEQSKAEYLLRRNLQYYEGHALYSQLFGTVKQEEFDNSIEAFRCQFRVELKFVQHHDLLDDVYHISQNAAHSADSQLLAIGNTVNFSYSMPDVIEVEIVDLGSGESLLLHWVNGVWESRDGQD